VAVFRRLRFDAGEPLNYAENFLPLSHAEAISDEDLAEAPMTMVLRDVVGLSLRRIENAVEARAATPVVAELLGVNPLDPVLLSTNLTYAVDGTVVDAAFIHYRADRFRFIVSVDLP
jgi:GntR family transcriptional regulator